MFSISLKKAAACGIIAAGLALQANAQGNGKRAMPGTGNTDGKSNKQRVLLDPANIDQSVKPGDNFYQYANGSWLKSNPIPATETRWGSFNELQEFNYSALRRLLQTAAKNVEGGTKAQGSDIETKVGAYYLSGMDSATVEKLGLEPLQQDMKRINAINSAEGVFNEIAYQHSLGLNPVFSFYVGPDDKNVTKQAAQFFQGGLGMPDRDYYFKDDDRSRTIREAYRKYLVEAFSIMGDQQGAAEANAKQVYALEEAMAKASMTRVEMRDPYKVYNKISSTSMNEGAFSFATLQQKMKVPVQDSIIIGQPEFFRTVAGLINKDVDGWKSYFRFHLFNDMAPYLFSKVNDLQFGFYGRTIRGQKEQKPRWKRVLAEVDGSIGELLGQMYVDKHFKPESKERMLKLVRNLQDTYADRIKRLDWMSEQTKQRALTKLNTFIRKIGYPDKWRDYNRLRVVKDNYVANVLAAGAFNYEYMVSKLGRPVDKTEWGMTPPTVNAYYNPAFNEIVFPAGILQYPFFDADADDAVNYGGIGAVIGHEMTHGFDDQGRQYDANGNLNDWWQEDDAKKFTDKANVVVQQFNNYTVLDTVHVNGELTLGENLADLGGLAIAYEAFLKTDQAKKGALIDGFTPQQRFFLSWAQVWRANTRPEEMMSRIVTDPHSPNELRANGPLSNMEEFYKAFNVQPGNKMYRRPEERARVW